MIGFQKPESPYLYKNAFSIGGKSEIGGGGVKNGSKKSDIIYGRPQIRSFHSFDIGSVGQRPAKLLAVKFGGLKKVCCPAPDHLKPVSPDSTQAGSKSFSMFDRQQLCSPLTFRPWINCIERSQTPSMQISSLSCMLAAFWRYVFGPLEVTSFSKGLLSKHTKANVHSCTIIQY